ncbi:hypothetical protein VPH35_096885 [Triticum aestivum]
MYSNNFSMVKFYKFYSLWVMQFFCIRIHIMAPLSYTKHDKYNENNMAIFSHASAMVNCVSYFLCLLYIHDNFSVAMTNMLPCRFNFCCHDILNHVFSLPW